MIKKIGRIFYFYYFQIEKWSETSAIYFVVDAARCSASICLKTKFKRGRPLEISTVKIQLYVQSVTGAEPKRALWLVGMIFEINTDGAGNGSCTNGTDILKHENEIKKYYHSRFKQSRAQHGDKMTSCDRL